MANLDHLTTEEIGEDFAWIDRRIGNLINWGPGIGAVSESMWDAHDALESELIKRGVLKFN